MKTILTALVIMGCAAELKAQQLPAFPKQQPLQQFRFAPDSLTRNNFSFKQLDSLPKGFSNPNVKLNTMASANIDNMPVVRPQGNYNMPIVQTDRTAYNMPVVGMRQPNVYIMKKPEQKIEAAPASNTGK